MPLDILFRGMDDCFPLTSQNGASGQLAVDDFLGHSDSNELISERDRKI